jgi:hypothetical protein
MLTLASVRVGNFRQVNPGTATKLILPHTEQAGVAVYVLLERG